MGKKKNRRKHDHAREQEHEQGRRPVGFGAVAGIAAMALEQVKTQLDSPAGRQMMATGLRAAADALAPRSSRAAEAPPRPAPPPTPAEPPAAPEPSAYAGNPAEPPREPSPPPRPEVPPEVARVIGSVAAGLEKWAAKLGTPKG